MYKRQAVHCELTLELVPGILLELFVAQRQTTVLLIDLQHYDLDFEMCIRDSSQAHPVAQMEMRQPAA